MMINRLIEPSMDIHRDGPEQKYALILEGRDRLRDRMNAHGMSVLTDDEKTHIVLANVMEVERDALCTRIASAKITARVNSTKLTQRFLCAVIPGYLAIKPTDRGIVAEATETAVASFYTSMAAVNEAGGQKRAAEQLLRELEDATVLAGDLRVMKPLKIAPK